MYRCAQRRAGPCLVADQANSEPRTRSSDERDYVPVTSQGGPGLEQRRETVTNQPDKRAMDGQVPVPSPRDDGEDVNECVPSGSLALKANSGRPGGVCVEAGSQTSDKQTSNQPPGTRVSGGVPFLACWPCPGSGSGSGSGSWVIGGQRGLDGTWHQRCGDTGGLWLLDW